ncbi:MAG: protein-L-isoaspartate(D-aspartate) O-methyltransferase [Candidatus Acidoferrales bacterium]
MALTKADLTQARAQMVEWQLRRREISDRRVLEAFLEVPRHEFVLPEQVAEAYEDHPLPIGEGQTISQPYMVAVMTEALRLQGEEKVLEVGTGSGYQTAILAWLARHVYTIEKYASLSARAQENLRRLEIRNVTCLVGDGSPGYREAAPYEGILVTAAAPRVPQMLSDQLAEGGRLVIPVGEIYSQELLLVEKHEGRLSQKTINYCRFVPLTGKYGWGGNQVN